MIPVDDSQSAAVVGKVETGNGRNICESNAVDTASACVDKTAVAFLATIGPSLANHQIKLFRR